MLGITPYSKEAQAKQTFHVFIKMAAWKKGEKSRYFREIKGISPVVGSLGWFGWVVCHSQSVSVLKWHSHQRRRVCTQSRERLQQREVGMGACPERSVRWLLSWIPAPMGLTGTKSLAHEGRTSSQRGHLAALSLAGISTALCNPVAS